MNARYVSIAAASLAALIMGLGPAAAQTSATDSPSTPGGSVTVNPNASTGTQGSSDTKDDSPSASPRGEDGKATPDDSGDRQKMKDHEKIDMKGGQDRADDTAGDRGGHGRDTAGMPGSSR